MILKKGISFKSNGENLSATIFLPQKKPAPAVIFAHGLFEFKEDYFDYAKGLAKEGFIVLTVDMHGHGASGGNRYSCNMREWSSDVINAMNYLETLPEVKKGCFGLVGLSSGGTTVLSVAAKPDLRVRAVVSMAATIKTNLSIVEKIIFYLLGAAGIIKQTFTGRDLRVDLTKLANQMVTAENPEVNKYFHTAPQLVNAFKNVPFPGVWHGFIIDIRHELPRIKAPTLIIHGAQDQMEPPDGAHILYNTLTCEKEIHIIENSGHLLHLDYKKQEVFTLLLNWFQRYL